MSYAAIAGLAPPFSLNWNVDMILIVKKLVEHKLLGEYFREFNRLEDVYEGILCYSNTQSRSTLRTRGAVYACVRRVESPQ